MSMEELNERRLVQALENMWHEQDSDSNIMMWANKQKDFWGGVQWVKDALCSLNPKPLQVLYRTGDLRYCLKKKAGPKVSVSRAQLAVALCEMGFVIVFKNTEHFNTNFPSKCVVDHMCNEGLV